MVPSQARDAEKGGSLFQSRNAAWRHLPRNPKGRASFCTVLRYSSFIWNNQITLLTPCPAQKLAPARPCMKRQQTLEVWDSLGRVQGKPGAFDVIACAEATTHGWWRRDGVEVRGRQSDECSG
jgi:hypothetical protein